MKLDLYKRGDIMSEQTFQNIQNVQTEIMDIVSEAAGIPAISLLSPAFDYAMTFAGGKQTKKFLDISGLYKMNVRIFGKGTDQLSVAERLCGICNFLTYRDCRKFRKTDSWEIRRITLEESPSLTGQEENGEWFYSCMISITYYYKPERI